MYTPVQSPPPTHSLGPHTTSHHGCLQSLAINNAIDLWSIYNILRKYVNRPISLHLLLNYRTVAIVAAAPPVCVCVFSTFETRFIQLYIICTSVLYPSSYCGNISNDQSLHHLFLWNKNKFFFLSGIPLSSSRLKIKIYLQHCKPEIVKRKNRVYGTWMPIRFVTIVESKDSTPVSFVQFASLSNDFITTAKCFSTALALCENLKTLQKLKTKIKYKIYTEFWSYSFFSLQTSYNNSSFLRTFHSLS